MLRLHSRSDRASDASAPSPLATLADHLTRWHLSTVFADASDKYDTSITPAAPAASVAPAAPAGIDDPGREGMRLGLIIASVVWLWIALVDMALGTPLRTFSVLGGVIPFTIMHVLLALMYGVGLVTIVHAARDEPTLMAGLVFGSLLLEIAFVMVTVVLANVGVGTVAWLQIFGGSVIAAAVTLVFLSRRHPLRALLHRAHEEE